MFQQMRTPAQRRGRPKEDVFARRMEMYEAAAPLLLKRGARDVTMVEIARAAFVSVATLYNYFPSKRDLALFPLRADAEGFCSWAAKRYAEMARSGRRDFLASMIEDIVRHTFLMRPAMLAAVELGTSEAQDAIVAMMHPDQDAHADIVAAASGMSVEDARRRSQAATRLCVGAMLDRTTTVDDLRANLRWLLDPGSAPSRGAVVSQSAALIPAAAAAVR